MISFWTFCWLISFSSFHLVSSLTFSSIELAALREFYDSLDGGNWQWLTDTDEYGIPWDVYNASSDPCADRWQGIHCTCLVEGSDAVPFPYTEHELQYSYTDYVETYSISGDAGVTTGTPCFVRQINLIDYGLEGTIPESLASLEYLQALQLSSNRISGTINPFLWNLSHLESFVVGENAFTGAIPGFLEIAAKNLTYFALANNDLEGTFPACLCNLTRLVMLTLGASSSITGPLPSCVGSLTQLDTFSLVSTSMNGPVPPEVCNWDRIRDFSIAHNSFTSFPDCFGESGTLEHVNIRSNNGFDGSLSDSWCNNSGLVSFRAATNKFTGHIPSCFGRQTMSSLSFFDIRENLLSGTVVDDLWNISILVIHTNGLTGTVPDIQNLGIQVTDFHSNSFTGTIPASICQWNLTYIVATQNQLTGPLLPSNCSKGQLKYMGQFYFDQNYLTRSLPDVICGWNSIYFFDVSYNALSSTLPGCIDEMANPIMKWMYFDGNLLHGMVPDAICAWSTVAYMDLSFNSFSGSFPNCFGNLTNSYVFYAASNKFNGTLPEGICQWKNLQYIQIQGNLFSGSLPDCISEWKGLQVFYISENKFTGVLEPSSWCDFQQSLQVFDCGYNLLRGTFPLCFWSFKGLEVLALSHNQFSGPLFFPDSFCDDVSQSKLPYLQFFAIEGASNSFTGTIPSCIHEIMPSVIYFSISGSNINGSIPDGFCMFNNLEGLSLSSLALTGTIPDCWTNQQSILLQITFWDNKLSGTLPPSFCNLDSLQSIQVSNNELIGTIPVCSRTQWQSMLYFNISFNHLSGTLADSLCALSGTVKYLAINNNNIVGTIPQCFGDFNQLQYLLLSDNNLSGPLSFLRHKAGAPQLLELLIDNNQLTGPIFEDLANRTASSSGNRSQLSLLLSQRNGFTGSLPTISWQGRYNMNLSHMLGEMTIVDVSENRLTGKVEPAFFQFAPLLSSLLLIKNCFSGLLSDNICLHGNSQLEILALDGLSAGCDQRNALGIHDTAEEVVHGTIPACLFSLPKLRTLHAAGNNFIGTLPSIVGQSLTDLSLSNNNLRGSIPVNIQRKTWTNLDLAYNKLEGSLVDSGNASQWLEPGRAIKLNRNRLSGAIPSQYQSAEDVNILDGNLFFCRSSPTFEYKQELPQNDPDADNYSCGTDNLNVMLFLGLGLTWLLLLMMWLWISFSKHHNATTAALANNFAQVHINSAINEEDISICMSAQEQVSTTTSDQNCQVDIASKEDDQYSTSTEVRSADIVLEHKADDPYHPANRQNFTIDENRNLEHKADDPDHPAYVLPRNAESRISSSKSSEFELAMVQLKERCVGSVRVLRADLHLLRNNKLESIRRASVRSVRPTERLTRFLQVCDHQRRLFLSIAAMSLLFLLPVYLVLSYFYKTHSSSYAWIISAAYDGGALPAIVLLSIWFVIFVWLHRAVDPELHYRGRGLITRKMLQRLYQISAFWQEYSLIAAALLINALVMLLINGIYVYLVVRNGRGVSVGLQILLATFKLLYNVRFISKLIRGSEWLQRLRKRQELLRRGIPASALGDIDRNSVFDRRMKSGGESLLAEDESYSGDDGLIPGIYSEAILVVFNFVVAPIIAASLADTNCFYSAIIAPLPLQTSLEITFSSPYLGFVFSTNGASVLNIAYKTAYDILETNFVPPFTYSGQCVSSIIATYEPVFVLLYLANLFVLPVIMFFRRVYFKRGLKTEQQPAENNYDQSSITTTELMTGSPKKAQVLRSLNFDRRTFVVSRVTNLSVLLTFGWVFPPLAILIALVEVRDSLYLVAALQQYIVEVGGMVQAEKRLGWHMTGIPASLPYLQLRCMPFGALFLGLLLYDIAADELGLIQALWAPLLMFFGSWLFDQLTLAWLANVNRDNQYKGHRAAGGIYIAHSTHDDDGEAAANIDLHLDEGEEKELSSNSGSIREVTSTITTSL